MRTNDDAPLSDNEAARKDLKACPQRIYRQLEEKMQEQDRLHRQNAEATRRQLDKEKQSWAKAMANTQRRAAGREDCWRREIEEKSDLHQISSAKTHAHIEKISLLEAKLACQSQGSEAYRR